MTGSHTLDDKWNGASFCIFGFNYASPLANAQACPTSVELHVWSQYGALLNPWLEGFIQALAKVLHNLPRVDIQLIKGTANGSADHEV